MLPVIRSTLKRPVDTDRTPFGMTMLIRAAGWGLAAATAVTIAVFSGNSPEGAMRVALAYNAIAGGTTETQSAIASQMASQAATRDITADAENFRIKEGLRVLAADRDRLAARLVSVERNLDDITGSISRQTKAATAEGMEPPREAAQKGPRSAAPDTAAPQSAEAHDAPTPAKPQNTVQNSVQNTVRGADAVKTAALRSDNETATDDSAVQPGTGRIAFGVEIGGARTLTAVRTLWSTLQKRHGPLFANMRPVVTVREPKTGFTELRLVVGPLESAQASARLCASLAIARQHCQTAIFEGQRLAQQ